MKVIHSIFSGSSSRGAMLALLGIFVISLAYGQTDRALARDGNKLYNEKKYTDAEVKYKKSLSKNKDLNEATFNLGDAYYKQEKYDDAAQQYQDVIARKPGSEILSKAYHNLGNSLLKGKKYEESINAYKNALKASPSDNDTRYNLAYAQSMLRQQQQQQQQQKQDQNKDKKDQDKKDQQSKQQENKDKQDQQKQQQQQQQAQQKQGISKEDAERMLQALNNDEKNRQKKLLKKEATRVQIEKDW
jgi:Ca-activated chloride channel homolog